ncbi:MAG TPA: DUF4388 domain-containing protein [Anaeromyxobacteraceae bacterium]|nr:DUF4388 domain-containing protein [Anaeromyxobacteraceae bacterium]
MNALLEKERERLEREDGFAGSLSDAGILELVQTLERWKKSGALRIEGGKDRVATVWFREGRVVDCEVGRLVGEVAFYRLLTWRDGQFAIELGPAEREERIGVGTQELFVEGKRRIDEWGRIVGELPSFDGVFRVDYDLLAERLADLPDSANGLIRLLDGKRTLAQVIEQWEQDDVAAARTISKLCSDGIVRPMESAQVLNESPAPAPRAVDPGESDWFSRSDWFSCSDEGGREVPDVRAAIASTPPPLVKECAAPPPRIVRFPAKRKEATSEGIRSLISPPAAPGEAAPAPSTTGPDRGQALDRARASRWSGGPLRKKGVQTMLAALVAAGALLLAWEVFSDIRAKGAEQVASKPSARGPEVPPTGRRVKK